MWRIDSFHKEFENMIEIKLTKEQYEDLIKLVYLGNWIINASRTEDIIEKYENLTQYIYSFAKEAGLEKYFEYDKKFNKFFPTEEFEKNTDIKDFLDEYNDEVFWQELIFRMAGRDLVRKYGEEAIRKMPFKERMILEYPFIEKYDKEFSENGIENLEIKE